MNVIIEKSTLKGKISAISSKSHAHRALICASLSDNESVIRCDNISKDIQATVNCLNDLGADITYLNNNFYVKPIDVSKSKDKIDCGESGSTLRFLLPIICALGLKVSIKTHGRLSQRPLYPLDRELNKNGCVIQVNDDIISVSGKLKASEFLIEGNVSSQFISGLLFALPLIDGKSKIFIKEKFESYSYVLLTLDVLKKYGITYKFENNSFELINSKYNSCDCVIEGDWSNAAFWLCAGAMLNDGLTVENLAINSVQGDKKIIDILSCFGAKIETNGNSVHISKSKFKGIVVDASDIPDLVPIICVLACCVDGNTTITNAQRLRLKESDRIKSVVNMISSFGGIAQETEDGLIISGCKLKGGVVNSYNDHRIAMSAAIASIICEKNIEIIDAESVEKSYPMFYNDFKKLNGKVKEKSDE
ncbi:MAG: 3-phosphoshikimate 1-carboxyvinyltransferase [Clostridia bacterium]|nr:3-phosphoshikimate 1-carboxyvinyltransferase [Clostridia bacterium]